MLDISIDGLLELALGAGREIQRQAAAGLGVTYKNDGTPVSNADRIAEHLIRDGLRAMCPSVPIVSEEDLSSHGQAPAHSYFLVDALDGTREFLQGLEEYTVNIALIVCGEPTVGLINAPARQCLYWTLGNGKAWVREGGHTEQLHARLPHEEGLVAVTSRSGRDRKFQEFVSNHVSETIGIGSSLKFCLLASGQADVYVRMKQTNEWDTAAGVALLRAAGGSVVGKAGENLRYGNCGYTHGGFVARGRCLARDEN